MTRQIREIGSNDSLFVHSYNMQLNTFDSVTANEIGHITLLLIAAACALSFRGIPIFVWVVAYLASLFIAPAAWSEMNDASLKFWLLSTLISGSVTALLYFGGVRLLGSEGQPWLVFRIPGILAPLIALVASSGFVRALYLSAHRDHEQR